MIQTLRIKLSTVHNRIGMYVYPVNYFTVVALIGGIIYGYEIFDNRGISVQFRNWLKSNKYQISNMSWDRFIISELCAGNEEESIKKAFELWDKFLSEQTDL